ncbi:MAG: Crp/Fnr family transcriptional regulator [Anaerofustis stercorihominis]|nr:Crp/Fnr family transcriptional regulator [Anaerofustis stercorihominis]
MEFVNYFSVWNRLSEYEKSIIEQSIIHRDVPAGTVIYNSDGDCLGLVIITTGQLRAYITSDEGKEVTLYRLFPHDVCLFSAACAMKNIQFDITISTEKDSNIYIIPAEVYKKLMDSSLTISNFTNEIMSARLTEVMWMIEQVVFRSMDKRLASFLIEESVIEDTSKLQITHEMIASHLGSAREVISRLLKYFSSEGIVSISRGVVEITDEEKLRRLSER